MCTDEHALTDLRSAGIGEMECEWLHLVRLHCMSYEHNQAEGWDRALAHAEMRYGADEGPSIASRVAVLIRAMRDERRGGFGYLSPFCPNCRLNVTRDEWQLIALMRAGYRGLPRDIDEAAADFARRTEAPVLAAAAARFGTAVAAVVTPPKVAVTSRTRLH
jgi:hypothetical protein